MVDHSRGAHRPRLVVAAALLAATVPLALVAAPTPASAASGGTGSLTLSDAQAGADAVTATVVAVAPAAGALAGLRIVLPDGSGVGAQRPSVIVGGKARVGAGSVEAAGTIAVRWTMPVPVRAGMQVRVRLVGVANPARIGRLGGRVDLLGADGSTIGAVPLAVAYGSAPACGSFRAAGWIRSENNRAGASWRIVDPDSDIEGYADRVSAQCGETVTLKVSTSAPSYSLQVFRMGYYGGSGARLVHSSGSLIGVRQVAPVVRSATGTVTAPWKASATLRVGGTWPPGQYLIKLRSSTGHERFVPLTVRDDGSRAALTVQSSVLTWQAYNTWGGYSLYRGPGNDPDTRGVIASFDRPYAADGQVRFGDGQYVQLEQPFVAWAEQRGLDLTYVTDVDLDARPALLQRHRALVLLTHDEYWTPTMHAALQAARDRGVNVALLGANAVYWKAALSAGTGAARRTLTVYRTADRDPMWGVAPAKVTNRWRDAPVAQPEAMLLGQMYDCVNTTADGAVTAPGSWVFAGTGVHDLDTLSNIVYWENDRYWPFTAPKNVEILAHARFPCAGHGDLDSGWDLTYYTAPSKAGVFSAGTLGWICNLDASCPPHPGDTAMQTVVSRITANVLAAFAAGPAGVSHPSVANAGQVCARLGCVGSPAVTPVDTAAGS